MDMSTEDHQTATDHLLSSHANPENNADVNQNSFPIDSSILDPALDPALDFAMSTPNPSASDTTTPNFLSSASNAFLAAINRFTGAIAPTSDDGTPHAMASDIPVPLQLKANSNPDEDAPHGEDEESSEVDPRFADATSQNQPGQSLSGLFAQANALSEGSVTSISEARMVSNGIRTRTSSATPSYKDASTSGRKRGSSERITPRKPSVRIKPPEQLAAEALIEQQNPNATKNQLRSLKLRALHAGRIAERELGMSEEEKTRRLRLREYVRHKREQERAERAKAPTPQASGDGPINETKEKSTNFPVDANRIGQTHDPKLFAMPASSRPPVTETRPSARPSKPATITIPPWQDPALNTPQRHPVLHMGPPASAPTTRQVDSNKRKKSSLDNPTGSEPRRKYYSRVKTPEQSSIEAQIERDHPNATKNQLKSLKLRALHAGRIAERERDMPEKEKARRLKLREYMRRRREEERGEARLEPLIPHRVIPPPPAADQGRPQPQLQPRPEASDLRSTELNAADHSAAFSIMELTNTFQHQFQPQQSPSVQTNHNLHLHPLFQMPVASTPSTQLAPQYDPTIDQNYALSNVWSNLQQHRSSISTSTHGETSTNDLITDDLVESALHAALQEACKAHNPANDDRMQYDQGESSSGINGSTTNPDQAAAMEQERIRIAEEEILGVERARIADAEMALIAAAAAEVEKAHMFGNESMPAIIQNEESG